MATATITWPQAGRRIERLRLIILIAAVALPGLACVRLAFVQGLVRRITIDGPSMAPTLLNEHFTVLCGDCGFRFVLDAEFPPVDGRGVCPNCGHADNPLAGLAPRPADRVLIDRWPLRWSIARGQIVAAALPAGELGVKRVSGLPGEKLSIRGGDLYAGGQLIRRSPAELRQALVLVHDNDHQPRKTKGLPPRWRPLEPPSDWRATGGEFHIQRMAESDTIDWIAYQHWACTGHPQQPRTAPSAVYDYDSYNQGENRALNRVTDVLATCRVQSAGTVAFAVDAGGERIQVLVEPARRIVVERGNELLAALPLATRPFYFAADVLFGLCDRQLLLVADGRTLLQFPIELAAAPNRGALAPLAVGARGSAEVSNLKVWRDIYYLPPSSAPWQMDAPLASSQVALLGDNQPVSIDSRHWQPAGVPLANLLGRVYRPFWSGRR